MAHLRLALSIACLTGCSFIDDFDDFRIETSAAMRDASPSTDGGPRSDAAAEAGVVLVDCSTAEDGKACGSGGDLLCISRICQPSVCGDAFVNQAKQEQCEDLNLTPADGCEPDTCRYSCAQDSDCDNGFVCDGEEACVDHACLSPALDPALMNASCQRFDGVAGQCDAGYCIPVGCGDGVVDTDRQEECDGAQGCRPDCTMGCVSDGQCSDADACNGVEDCELATGACKTGPVIPCADQDACTEDGPCSPATGCTFTLIDGDRDGYAPGTCGKGSTHQGDDCNDGDPTVHPGGTEYCDGVDNDCDTMIDENAVKATCYPDADGDGFPSQEAAQSACTCPKNTLPERDDKQWDCWDDAVDAGRDVFPGQSMSFATGYNARCAAPGSPCTVIKSYDYDCDGKETPFYTEQGRTSCGALGGALGCTPSGYTGVAPSCGDAASYLTCTPAGGLLGGCDGAMSDLAQPCR